MWILGLDTATWTASAGVARDGQPVAERTARAASSHACSILPLIEDTLRAARIGVDNLDAVAVSAGPGSFTGLRIGLSTAKGLAYAANLRIVAVPTLEALARAAGPRNGTVCPILDARKGEVYVACYRWRDGVIEQCAGERAIAPDQLPRLVQPPCTFVGDGVDAYADLLRDLFRISSGMENVAMTLLPLSAAPPSGGMVARMGWEQLSAGVETSVADLEPHYVRPSEAELKSG